MEDCATDVNMQYRKVFQELDGKKTGLVKVEDVATTLQKMGNNVTMEEIQSTLSKVTGTTTTGSIVFEEFAFLMSEMGMDVVEEGNDMSLVFQYLDKDGDGFISPKELKDLLIGMGDNISETDLSDMISEADRDGDGRVSFEDFVHVMTAQGARNKDPAEGKSPLHETGAQKSPDESMFEDSKMNTMNTEQSDRSPVLEEPLYGKKMYKDGMKRRMSCFLFGTSSAGGRRSSSQQRPRSRSSCGTLSALLDIDMVDGQKMSKKRRSFGSNPSFLREMFKKRGNKEK